MTEIKYTESEWRQDKRGTWLSILVDSPETAKQYCENQEPGKKYVAELKEYRKKRSLDANAYCWVLIGQLAAKLRITPLEVYREAIRAIGGNYYVTPIKNDAVPRYRQIWEAHGLGWICEEMGDSKLVGYTNVISYYGSSEYDTRQMSRLIDLIVMECKEQGIETMTPRELALLKEGWKNG